ncbi:MAG: hypothetical protein V3573_06835 [Desulfovibrionaceae bacterium]
MAELVPPPYWWLLALAGLGQVVLLLLVAIRALRGGDAANRAHGLAVVLFVFGALSGIVYGFVQSDAVFALGEICAVILVLRWAWSTRNKEEA